MEKKTIPTKKTEIKHILFDIGNVLFVDTEFVFDTLFHKEWLTAEQKDQYEQMIHITERGQKPVSALLQTMIKVFNLNLTVAQMEILMTDTELIKPMWQLANQLQKNYQVSLLTNNQKTWPEKQAKKLKVDIKQFKIFNSAELGMRKPGSEIYEYVTKKLKAKPEEILFIDDRGYNLVEPKKLGWHTIRFTGDVPKVTQGLKKLGVKAKM